ncbi:hypothetical protein WJX81_003402 [Elliptochloris bilobata]|uniref:NADH-ubiquinone oxidoreductase 21kDa subunit N-terminal domain-containing protein n=1 Tax=Elliptochloris bilobata TaxID=381761 RepID=A0AAW1QKI6_9CHLO
MWTTMKNYSWREYCIIVGLPLFIAPFSYQSGVRPRVPLHSMCAGMSLGLLGGVMLAHQRSWGRLMGFLPNDREVELYLRKGHSPNKAG